MRVALLTCSHHFTRWNIIHLPSKQFFPADEITTHPALESYSVLVDERQRLHQVPEKDKYPNHITISQSLIITHKSSVEHFIMSVQTSNGDDDDDDHMVIDYNCICEKW